MQIGGWTHGKRFVQYYMTVHQRAVGIQICCPFITSILLSFRVCTKKSMELAMGQLERNICRYNTGQYNK